MCSIAVLHSFGKQEYYLCNKTSNSDTSTTRAAAHVGRSNCDEEEHLTLQILNAKHEPCYMDVQLPNGKFRKLPTFHSYTGRNRDEVNKSIEVNKNVEIDDGAEIPEPTILVVCK